MGFLNNTGLERLWTHIIIKISDSLVASKEYTETVASGKADKDTLNAHIADEVLHITDEERTIWNSKMNTENPVGAGAFSINRKADTTVGPVSVAVGNNTEASAPCSFAEGNSTTASGMGSHAEGNSTTASGMGSHAEGMSTTASNQGTHAEGMSTTASGMFAHAEGNNTLASSNATHAEGNGAKASGYAAHAEGLWTEAAGDAQHAQGKYNIVDNDNVYAHIIGNGTSENARSNAHTVDWEGNAWFAGNVYVGGTNQSEGSKLLSLTDLNSAELITIADIDAICGGTIQSASEVTF